MPGKARFASEPFMLTCIRVPSRVASLRSRSSAAETRALPDGLAAAAVLARVSSARALRTPLTALCRASMSSQTSTAKAVFSADCGLGARRARIDHHGQRRRQGLAVDAELDRVGARRDQIPARLGVRIEGARDLHGVVHAQIPDQPVHAGLRRDHVVGHDLVGPLGRLDFLGRAQAGQMADGDALVVHDVDAQLALGRRS